MSRHTDYMNSILLDESVSFIFAFIFQTQKPIRQLVFQHQDDRLEKCIK